MFLPAKCTAFAKPYEAEYSNLDYSRTVGCVKRTAWEMVGYDGVKPLKTFLAVLDRFAQRTIATGLPCSTHPT